MLALHGNYCNAFAMRKHEEDDIRIKSYTVNINFSINDFIHCHCHELKTKIITFIIQGVPLKLLLLVCIITHSAIQTFPHISNKCKGKKLSPGIYNKEAIITLPNININYIKKPLKHST